MSTGRPDPAAVRRLIRLAGVAPGGPATDRELVDRYVRDRSEGAFADLMARHGPMVLAVCRRHVRDPHAAADAFQATFIVLARKAGTVRWRESIGGWLFEVANRVAHKVAAQEARRRTRERDPSDAPEPVAPPDAPDLTALQRALDEELRRLPEKLRTPVVLCHLERLSQDEVARRLGISAGQLRGRLYRARERLRERLVRRGFCLAAVLLALALGERASAVPPVLAALTLRLAGAPDQTPTAVQHLVLGVIRDMTTTFKTFAALGLIGALALTAAGFGVRPGDADARNPVRPALRAGATSAPHPARGAVRATKPVRRAGDEKEGDKGTFDRLSGTLAGADAAKNAVTLTPDEVEEQTTIELDPKAAVLFGGKAINLGDLQPGMRVEVLTPNGSPPGTKPTAVHAAWPRQPGEFRAHDAARGTLTVQVTGDDDVGVPLTLTLARGARVVVDGLPAALDDVPTGARVELDLALDKKTVTGVETGPLENSLPGTLTSCDAEARSLVVELEVTAESGERRVTIALPVSADVRVRLAGAGAKLSDLKAQMPVRLRLSADHRTVVAVLAAPPLEPKQDE